MDTKALRQKVLDLAIRGKLVPQDPNDEPASVLLERIRAQKQQMVKEGKLKAKDIKNDSIIFVGEDNLHYEKFADGTVKCIEDEIPFDLPDGWAWSKINTIAFVTKLAGFEYTKNIAPNLCEGGIPLFKGKNVQNSTIIYEFESYIPEAISDELQRSQITKKCILTPYVGTIGNIGIHSKPGKYHLGSNVGKIELYNDTVVLLEEYVVSYLQSGYGYQQLTKHMKATAQASISIEAIRDVYLPVPPGNEQIRIWASLSKTLALVDSIDKTELDIHGIVNATKSKILDLAIRGQLVPQDPDDEPASVLLERIRAEKEDLIRQGKIKRDKKESVIFRGEDNSYYEKIGVEDIDISNEISFEVPKNWVWCRLSQVADIVMGSSPRGESICTDSHFTEFHQGKIYFSEYVISYSKQYTKEITKMAMAGSVLLCVRAPVGEVNITERSLCIGRGLAAIRPLSTISEQFFFYWLQAFKTTLVSKATGTTFIAITADVVKDLLIPLPPIEEQIRILNRINKSFSELSTIEAILS